MTLDEFKARAKSDLDRAYEAGKAQGGGNDRYNEGVQAEYDRFWNAYQDNGQRIQYNYAFAGHGWDDDSYNPKYPIKARNVVNMYGTNINITDTKVSIDITGDSSYRVTVNQMFSGAAKMKTIRSLKVNEYTQFNSNAFTGCSALEEISFVGVITGNISFVDCALLNADSIDNIFDHVANAQSVTFPSSAEATYDAKYGEGAFQNRVNAASNAVAIGW